jgi:hypothetical protein
MSLSIHFFKYNLCAYVALTQRFKHQREWFFRLPMETKLSIKRNIHNSRGYFNDEFTKQRQDWKEGLDIGQEGGIICIIIIYIFHFVALLHGFITIEA